MKRRSMIVLSALTFALGVGAILFFRSPETFWQKMAGDPDLGAVDFAEVQKTHRPNQFLLCPRAICQKAAPDQEPPVFHMTKERLKENFINTLGTETRRTVEDEGDELRFIMRSPVFRFPDTISVRFFDRDEGATLAIYARAQIGHSDFGANRKRVQRWMKKLEASSLVDK